MKILVIQQKMIGDVLTSSILFKLLRKKYPDAQLDYLINSNTYQVVEGNPFINNFIFFTKEAQTNKKALFNLGKQIKKTQYDVLIDVYSKLSSNLITILSGAKTKISYYKPYSTWVYDHNIKRITKTDSNAGLAIVNRLQLLEPLGISEKPIRPEIYLSEKEITNSKNILQSNGVDLRKPLYMISVLGSGKNKTYPFNYMSEVIDSVAKTTNGQILFNYIPNQLKDAESILNSCDKKTQKMVLFNVFGKDLREFLAITSHCNALIGNEGGAINMAKALNIPTFAIYSPWIDKATWSIFEEDGKNQSAHLKDFKTELYKNRIEKNMKSKALELYEEFKPELFINKLKLFLNKLDG
jgi:heptosyltransferase-2